MVLYDTAVTVPSLGMVANETLTLQSLQTTCLNVPPLPPSLINIWLFGVTIAAATNPDTVFNELQSVLVLAQTVAPSASTEGTFLTPVLLNSVVLPGNNAP
jgi:hypothetical protein